MKVKGIILMLLCCIVFGIELLLSKYLLLKGVDPFTLALSMVVISAFLMLPVFFIHNTIRFDKRLLRDFMIIGFFSTGIAVVFRHVGMKYTTISNAGFLLAIIPVFTVLFSYYLVKEKFPKKFYLILALISAGVILISTKGAITKINKGDAIILAVTAIFGFTNSYAKRVMQYAPSLLVTAGRMAFGALFLLLVMFVTGRYNIGQISQFWFLLLIAGILFALTRILFYKGIEIESSSIAATFVLATYPLVAVAAYFLFGEKMVLVQIIGAALVMMGILSLTNIESSAY